MKKEKKNKKGLAIHCHHNILVEYCYDYEERVKYIKDYKPKYEPAVSLKVTSSSDIEPREGGEKECWCGDGCPTEGVCCGPKENYEGPDKEWKPSDTHDCSELCEDKSHKPKDKKCTHRAKNGETIWEYVARERLWKCIQCGEKVKDTPPQFSESEDDNPIAYLEGIKPPQDWEKEFDERYPSFQGVGAPFPIFRDNPDREHIKSFIRALVEKTREEAEKTIIAQHKESCPTVGFQEEINAGLQLALKDSIEKEKEAKQALLAKLKGEVEGMKKKYKRPSYEDREPLLQHNGYQIALSDILKLLDTL